MVQIISIILKFLLNLLRNDYSLFIENLLLKHENLILCRKLRLQRIRISRFEKIILVILNLVNSITDKISIITPQTLLSWQRRLIASFWNFWQSDSHTGRKPVPADVKNIILDMKNANPSWGSRRIRDELLVKLQISLHRKTIQHILTDFRRKGKMRKGITWKQFLTSQIDSIFAMDLFTVDTVFNQRFYVLFIICHKTREIVHFAISRYPTKQFVKQQLAEFENTVNRKVYMIRDQAGQFWLDYSFYNIVDVCTSVRAPNMNSIAERFVKSIRNEALDNFLLFNQKQISKIIFSYIEYYNELRPHQGVNSIPRGVPPNRDVCGHELKGKVCSKSVVGGLIKHYFYEEAA